MQNIVIQFQRVLEHYEVYINGEFEQTCDVGEFGEVRDQLKNKYKNLGKSVVIYE